MINYNDRGFIDDKSKSNMYQAGKKITEEKNCGQPEKESFFKMTLKMAIKKAFKTVVVPTLKRFIDDVFEDTKNSLLYGEEHPIKGGFTNYRAPFKDPLKLTSEDHKFQRYEKCRLPSEQKAVEVMNRLYHRYRTDGKVTLAYFYELHGETFNMQDETWGWRTMAGVDAVETDRGYKILMPKLEEL